MEAPELHQLCKTCLQIEFESPILYATGQTNVEVEHYPNIASLIKSAFDGCHLCSLLSSALLYNSRDVTFTQSPSETVQLSLQRKVPCLGLVVTCGTKSAILDLLDPYYQEVLGYNPREAEIQLVLESGLDKDNTYEAATRKWPAKTELNWPTPFQDWTTQYKQHHRDHPHTPYPQPLDPHETCYVNLNPCSEVLLAQIRAWISNCIQNHSLCNNGLRDDFFPSRVIDVQTGLDRSSISILTCPPASGDRRYAVLSYRWKKEACTVNTTSENLEQRTKNFPESSLTNGMQDAIRLTRSLGLWFLWIDAICIVQNSSSDWEVEAAKMGNIYASAFLCISEDIVNENDVGFFAMRNALELRGCIHPTAICGSWPALISPCLPAPKQALDTNSTLEKRGWTLQERALSRRILHWTQFETIWECNKSLISERRPSYSPPERFRVMPDFWVDWIKERGWLQLADDKPRHLSHYEKYTKVWYSLVQDFSARALTVPTDKLPAIAGLARIFQDRLSRCPQVPHAEYIAGVWSHDLIQGLMWSRRGTLHEPRLSQLGDKEDKLLLEWQDFLKNEENESSDRKPENVSARYIASSFAWPAISAPVQYHRTGGGRQYKCQGPPNAKILAYEITSAGQNSFTHLTGGWMMIRGATTCFASFCQEDPVSGTRTLRGRVGLDDERHRPFLFEPSTIALLIEFAAFCNLEESRNRDWGVYEASLQCIILRPVDETSEGYRRIGLYRVMERKYGATYEDFEVVKTFEGHKWDVREVTLV